MSGLKDLNDAIGALVPKVNGNASAIQTINESIAETVGPAVPSSVTTQAIGSVNNQTSATAYTVQTSDFGALIIIEPSLSFPLSLNNSVGTPYLFFLSNLGSATAVAAPTSGTINFNPTWTIQPLTSVTVFFDGANWWVTSFPPVPQNFPQIAHEWIDAYDASTGIFSASQPLYSDIGGLPVFHDEPLTDGNGNFIFAGGDCIVVTGIPNP